MLSKEEIEDRLVYARGRLQTARSDALFGRDVIIRWQREVRELERKLKECG